MPQEFENRRTFAIISHPDAGKTTLTEKLLLYGGAIALAGSIKSKKAARHATSDWLKMEQERGISVTSSVMQFGYKDSVINLLDTPGHADFSEDTYRTLTAVDSALMVIDAAKGVEPRTIKLMEVCRMRTTPIITFINKFDRDAKDPFEILDEIERVLGIKCVPMRWPVGSGKWFKGVIDLIKGDFVRYEANRGDTVRDWERCALSDVDADENLKDVLELLEAYEKFDRAEFLAGRMTPVFFGSAIHNFGITDILDALDEHAPAPVKHETTTRAVLPAEEKFSGFVFKIQANMDPKHHDRVAFLRVCSGKYTKGMKVKHVREGRMMNVNNAQTFMAGSREHADEAYPGDIIGLPGHGGVKIGDTFTQGEDLRFTGIPNFAPELFKMVRSSDPLKAKTLHKGLVQLAEEGATQVFRPEKDNSILLGAVGVLQFDVVAHRLKNEYKVDCIYAPAEIATCRWVTGDAKMLQQFKDKLLMNIGYDGAGRLVYLAPTTVNLHLTMERWPELKFHETCEH